MLSLNPRIVPSSALGPLPCVLQVPCRTLPLNFPLPPLHRRRQPYALVTLHSGHGLRRPVVWVLHSCWIALHVIVWSSSDPSDVLPSGAPIEARAVGCPRCTMASDLPQPYRGVFARWQRRTCLVIPYAHLVFFRPRDPPHSSWFLFRSLPIRTLLAIRVVSTDASASADLPTYPVPPIPSHLSTHLSFSSSFPSFFASVLAVCFFSRLSLTSHSILLYMIMTRPRSRRAVALAIVSSPLPPPVHIPLSRQSAGPSYVHGEPVGTRRGAWCTYTYTLGVTQCIRTRTHRASARRVLHVPPRKHSPQAQGNGVRPRWHWWYWLPRVSCTCLHLCPVFFFCSGRIRGDHTFPISHVQVPPHRPLSAGSRQLDNIINAAHPS